MAQNRLNKLELTWIGKYDEDKQPLEPRILIENPEYSNGEVETGVLPNGKPWNGNMLIHGDNLLALKSLEQDYAGCVKCIFIDPPYNTGSAFEQYDDNLEHSLWLDLMYYRLQVLHNLLSNDGTIWVALDDNEVHYCKVMCDEIFGRTNFIQAVVWRSSDNSNNDSKQFSIDHNTILVYSKCSGWLSKRLPPKDSQVSHFKNPDNDPKGPWFDGNPISSPSPRENLMFDIDTPIGTIIHPPKNGWRWSKETIAEKMKSGEIYFSKDYTNIKRRTYLADSQGLPPSSLWVDLEETGHNRQAKYEQKKLFPDWNKDMWFATPKPEKLIEKVLKITTNDGDLVLDSFLGSGTTAAVAHKMGRRWIGVELGDHAYTHCAVRMQKVVDGSDQGGISKAQNWKGGGGFKFYELAPSLLNHDKHGNLVINKEYNADMLAAAMAKHEGFTYAPDSAVYWKQGKGAEKDYIFTTTQFLTVEALEQLHEQMGEGESLLICCTSFQPECRNRFANITLKKIPQMLLGRCEFDHDDYSLNIVSLPEVEDEECLEDDLDTNATSPTTERN
ncbi:MAG: site-specific DNA-methyltransferase [Bacteroidaceae bacterium]|nr:site-specific DNA-methyltransferase [Bacteroidaceae bacterium]